MKLGYSCHDLQMRLGGVEHRVRALTGLKASGFPSRHQESTAVCTGSPSHRHHAPSPSRTIATQLWRHSGRLQTPALVLAPGRILITRASAMFQGQLRRDSAAKLYAFMSPPLTVQQISFPLTLSRKCRPVASQLTTWPEAIHPAEQEESWD